MEGECVMCDVCEMMILCVIGEDEIVGEEVEVGGEESLDEKALTKRDIHTLNEQRRRDIIKVIRAIIMR